MAKPALKNIEELHKEVTKYVASERDGLSVAVIDTGAIIDIVYATSLYEVSHRGKNNKVNLLLNGYNFISNLDALLPLVILPGVIGEIRRHADTRVNGYTREIDEDSFLLMEKLAQKSFDFIRRATLFDRTINDDEIKYDVWNLSLQACSNCEKKHEEGYSEVDKDLLAYSAFLSKAVIREPKNQRINQVLVISPDQHILSGVDFFNNPHEFLAEKYTGIKSISTRNGRSHNGR